MKPFSKVLFIALLVTGVLHACEKKKTKVDPRVFATTGSIPPDLVCYGKGTNTYLPLDSLNSWIYEYKLAGVDQNDAPAPHVVESAIFNSIKYVKVTDRILTFYYRTDPVNNNIYRYDTGDRIEYLTIPGNPVMNQTWPISMSSSYKVSNLSATIITSKCTYTGLLEISEMNGNSAVTGKLYYKKGLGLVFATTPDNSYVRQSLISVDLK